jgi:hypothetical protein
MQGLLLLCALEGHSTLHKHTHPDDAGKLSVDIWTFLVKNLHSFIQPVLTCGTKCRSSSFLSRVKDFCIPVRSSINSLGDQLDRRCRFAQFPSLDIPSRSPGVRPRVEQSMRGNEPGATQATKLWLLSMIGALPAQGHGRFHIKQVHTCLPW